MKFYPALGYVEVEPIVSDSPILSDDKKLLLKATVIGFFQTLTCYELRKGDIIFFREHGFFELPDHDGIKHYVVRCHEDFILGIIKKDVAEQ